MRYNFTQPSSISTIKTATIYNHITGAYTTKEIASLFLDQYTIGTTMDCYLDQSSPYHAAANVTDAIHSSILVVVFILCFCLLMLVLFLCVTLKSFNQFVQKKEWDQSRGVWIELRDGVEKKEMEEGRKE